VKTEVDTAEQAVSDAVSLMDRARTLGSQGASNIASAETRASVASELDGILRQMVSLSATQVEGRYIFSGDADSTIPYAWDATQAYPVMGYLGSASTREVLHPSGTSFPVAHTANAIFDAGGSSVFLALAGLSSSLKAGDQNGIDSGLAAVSNAADHLNQQLAFYGTVQSQVNGAVETANKRQLSLKTQISSVQETDLTAAILDLTQAKTHQQAALEARAKLPRSSLFDFLG
jgi:flagellar hook-associated protein 3 FlgL